MKLPAIIIGTLLGSISISLVAQRNETALLSKRTTEKVYSVSPEKNIARDYSLLAEQNFHKDFINAKDASWTEISGKFRVSFVENAILHVVDYTSKGKLYSVIRYGEQLLSNSDRKLIETSFNGAKLLKVAEVKMAGERQHVFIIVLEDAQSMKTVQLIGNDLQVIGEDLK